MSETIRMIHSEVCVFDVEFVPDIELGRRLLDLPQDISDASVADLMVAEYSDDRGIMKSVMYRIVSIAAIIRKVTPDGIKINLFSRPLEWDGKTMLRCECGDQAESHNTVSDDEVHYPCQNKNCDCEDYVADVFDERAMIEGFLRYLGETRPQIVGFASAQFDLAALWQRAIALGINTSSFAFRPAKPWDDYADYFGRGNGYNIDLMNVLGNVGRTILRLEQIAAASRIPAKIGGDGSTVAPMWFMRKRREIVDYNECDALTTYLLWLRCVLASGLLTYDQHAAEVDRVISLVRANLEKPHMKEFDVMWKRLNPDHIIEQRVELDTAPKAPSETVESPIAKSIGELVTAKQLGMIRALAREANINANAECESKMKCRTDELTKRAASDFIEHLQTLIAAIPKSDRSADQPMFPEVSETIDANVKANAAARVDDDVPF